MMQRDGIVLEDGTSRARGLEPESDGKQAPCITHVSLTEAHQEASRSNFPSPLRKDFSVTSTTEALRAPWPLQPC